MLPDIKARYTAKAIGCYFGRAGSDGDGNAQAFVPFEIVDGEFAGERITWAGTFAPGKATEITLKALKEVLGWQGDDLSELDDLDADGAARLLPNEVEIVCDMDEYNGEIKLKVKWVNAPGGGRMTKHSLGGADLKAFAAQMRGTIRSMGPGTRQSAAPRAPTRPAPQSARHPNAPRPDDDIPF